jgi:hypothetical protein
MDIKTLGESIVASVREFVAQQLAAVNAKLGALEQRMAEQPAPQDGAPGMPGADGRDALEIDVLSMIDTERSFRRGTFASHKGGLWRATRTTSGMDGWECIVDGVADVEVDMHGERGFVIRITKASGATITKDFTIPSMVYKDLFREGTIYAKGDVVTWAGHMWVCKQETDAKPVEGEVWRIAVKRGQDAKAVH